MLIEGFVVALIVLGIGTSYQDIKQGKISNRWIIFGLISTILLHGSIFFYGDSSTFSPPYLKALFGTVLALGIGFGLWFFGLWSAGDAKLFFVFSLLVAPIAAFRSSAFSSIDLLINIFVPLGAYLLLSSLGKTTVKEKIASIKRLLRPLSLLTLALLLFFISWPLEILTHYFPGYDLAIIGALLLALFAYSLENRFGPKFIWILGVLGAARVFFDRSLLSFDAWGSFLTLLLIVIAVRILVGGLARGAFTKEIPIGKLKEGMIPAEAILKIRGRVVKREVLLPSATARAESDLIPNENGLSAEAIRRLKMIPKKSGMTSLQVYETISFAPFIFLGALLQIALGGNVLASLLTLF